MVGHRLAIRRFRTRLALTGLREDAPPLAREMGRAVRELLPAAAGRRLEPLLGSHDGVLRIDRIALTLRLGRGDISAPRLADLLAREIARAVAERAEGSGAAPRIGAGFAFWPDHAGFAAAYLAHRLRLAPAPDWAFPDFLPLAQLPPHEAALELIAARPAILGALARLLGPAGAPALAGRLPEHGAALLTGRLLAGHGDGLPAGATAELAAMIAALPAGAEASPACVALGAAVAALSTQVAPEAETVRRTVMLARLAVALVALRAATLAIWGRWPVASDLAPEALTHLPEPARHLAREALAPLTAAEPVRAVLAGLTGPARHPAGVADPKAAGATTTSAKLRAISSPYAGIGLLLPAALAHGLPGQLSSAALHRTLAAALGPEAAGAARLDPLLAALAPVDPREPEPGFPPVPAALRAAVPEARRHGAAAEEGAAGWAACLTHAFAAGLRGFEASSLPYLRRQFLARPGSLHVAEDRLTLVLDPLPLGIVLRLSGLQGWTGRLPQLQDALLRIELRES